MKKLQLEPGLLSIFRWYVILRGIFFIVMPVVNYFFDHRQPDFGLSELILLAIFFVLNVLIPGGYAFSRKARQFFGNAYVLIGISYAAFGLILEQHYVSAMRGFWQPLPFMFILLILVAWQYRYAYVIVFTFGVVIFDIALREVSPPPNLPKFFFSEREIYILYGRMITSTISYLVLGYVVNRLVQAQKEQRQALSDANLKLVEHAVTVEQLSISRERNRLSRELHDTLAHTLSALAVQFDALSTIWEAIPEKARRLIEQMQATTLTGLDETRRALQALRATPLEDMGLALALRELLEDFSRRHELELHLDVHENIPDFSSEIEQCFYRVAQESLENIARHARATKLDVHLRHSPSRLVMIISDDGQGFDLKEKLQEHQLGIQGMRERAGIIGADLQVESQPGAGTTLKLILGENP